MTRFTLEQTLPITRIIEISDTDHGPIWTADDAASAWAGEVCDFCSTLLDAVPTDDGTDVVLSCECGEGLLSETLV